MTINTYKTLGQAAPAANSQTFLYTAPNPGGAIISSVVIVNRGTVVEWFSLQLFDSASAFKVALCYALRVQPKQTLRITSGLTLGPGESLVVNVPTGGGSDLGFSAFGTEQTSLGAIVPKILGALNGVTVNTLTDLYTVPGGKSAVVSSIIANNVDSGGLAQTWRAAVSVGGGAIANKDYFLYDSPLAAQPLGTPGQDDAQQFFVFGGTLAAGDKVRVLGSDAEMDFTLMGVEIT